MIARHLPNLITGLRFLLVIPTVWSLLDGRYPLALVLFAVAGFSDGLDGYLAKHYGWTSRIGGYLDPLADKTLLIATFVTLGVLGGLPAWLVIAVIVRDVMIFVGALLFHYRIAPIEQAEPRLLSKLNTFLQILLVLMVVFDQAISGLPVWGIEWTIYAVLVSTIASGTDYLLVWGRRAIQERQR